MSEFNYNLRGASDSVFKVPNPPSRSRRTNYNNTQSTYNNEVGLQNAESTFNTFKKVEERYEVLKKICPPEDVEKILLETVDRLTEACYEKMAEQLVRPSQTQAFSVGGSSVYSVNTRQSVAVGGNYGTSILNVQAEQPLESNRRKINCTAASKNHYGLLNAPVPERLPHVASCDHASATNDMINEPEYITKSQVSRLASSKKAVAPSNDGAGKEDPAAGLSIPLRIDKPPPLTQSKRTAKKQTSVIKELEVLPSEDEGDSLSVFFGRGRNALSKPSTSRTKKDATYNSVKAADISISLNRVKVANSNESNATSSKKRKASPQSDDVPPRKKSPIPADKEKRPSPDTTTTASERKSTKSVKNETTRKPKRNNTVISSRKKAEESVARTKENKENRENPRRVTEKSKYSKEIQKPKANIAPVVEKVSKVTSKNGTAIFDDGSFFGDVSSIVGSDSVLAANTIVKNATKSSVDVRNEMPSHFFSPFANIRSTSGVSAISTPLSKTVSKNALGKRLKKPSVVAELKSQQRRKPRKAPPKADVAPAAEKHISDDSESDIEVSDFSD